jgi:Holliday junction DNA helicase RuvA
LIGFVYGKLAAKSPPTLVLDVQGIGYEIEAPMTTFYDLPELGQEVKLYTHLVVREDAHILFGFAQLQERLLFRTLIRVNGVGPKLALVILSGLSAKDFHHCIENDDLQALVRLPGIGKKTAERLIIEMRDRLPDISSTESSDKTSAQTTTSTGNPRQEALSALIALGYKSQDATKMLQHVPADVTSCEAMIRYALQGAAS